MKKDKEPKPKKVSIEEKELEEMKDFKHKYLHLLADMENARKRLQKERAEIVKYAIENLILDFLNPIDHFENALKHTDQTSDEIKHWAVGFQMILNQFRDVLANNGVVPMETKGKEFDPHCHEAIEMVTSTDHPSGTIVEENLRGYIMGDKTLRPARVKVSKMPPEVSEEEKVNQE